jgi:hypothetical protein
VSRDPLLIGGRFPGTAAHTTRLAPGNSGRDAILSSMRKHRQRYSFNFSQCSARHNLKRNKGMTGFLHSARQRPHNAVMTKLLDKALEAGAPAAPKQSGRDHLAGNEGERAAIDPAHLPSVLEGLAGKSRSIRDG